MTYLPTGVHLSLPLTQVEAVEFGGLGYHIHGDVALLFETACVEIEEV